MEFLQEEMVVKDDLKNFATKDDLKNFATKDDIKDLKLHMNARFAEISSELDDIKASLARLEKKTQEDDDAMVLEIMKLKKRITLLEAQVFERQHA